MKKLTVAMIGCGPFCNRFVELFKNHPNVEKVYVCDLIREKAEDFSKIFHSKTKQKNNNPFASKRKNPFVGENPFS